MEIKENHLRLLLDSHHIDELIFNIYEEYLFEKNSRTTDSSKTLLTTRKLINAIIDEFPQLNISNFLDRPLNILDFDAFLEDFKEQINLDIEAAFTGDPSAVSKEEILLTYPGIYALVCYRFAHYLYEKVEGDKHLIPILPRMICEHAHHKTGIDIHPGAIIGKSFFIDHGVGTVIGETVIIGDNVRIYHGVTLGSLNLTHARGQAGKKRHPTIGNNCIIYTNTMILGGETIIGDNSIIGCNLTISKSVEANSIVLLEDQDIKIRKRRSK